jgi:hypothetical protein
MDTNVWQRLRQQFPARIPEMTSGKLMAALVILVVPGGLMLPLCYAAYAAVAANVAARKAGGRVALPWRVQAGVDACTYSANSSKSASSAERAM